jgi:hypothetical protein
MVVVDMPAWKVDDQTDLVRTVDDDVVPRAKPR